MNQELSLEPNQETIIHQGNNIVAMRGTGDVEFRIGDIRIEINADGTIAACRNKNVDAFTDGTVHHHPAAKDSQNRAKNKTEPEIGSRVSDGTIYAGISPATGKPLYATPVDARL